MLLRSSVLVTYGLLCGACVGTNPYYVDPTTATTTGGAETTTDVATTGGDMTSEGESEASTEPETTDPTPTGMTTSSEPVCGDGLLDEGEECDEGEGNGESDCNTKCELAFCGDGEEAPWEECDDGAMNGAEQSACTFSCEEAVCGDSQVSLGEECDHGESNVDANSFTCHDGCIEDYCGDGFLSPEEMCDPQENVLEHCNLVDCTIKKCGNGVLDGIFEKCDGDPDCLPNCMYWPEPTGLLGEEVEPGLIGTKAGLEVKLYCDAASFVGFYGKIDVDELWLAQVGARCGEQTTEKLGAHGFIVTHWNFSDSAPVGTVPVDYAEGVTQCAEEEVLVGIAGTYDGYVTSLSAICTKVTIVSLLGMWRFFPHVPRVVDPLVDEWDMQGEVHCPLGHAVSRLSVYADQEAITGVEIYCKMLGFSG